MRTPVLLISDSDERYLALRRSLPADRPVRVWGDGDGAARAGATALRGDPADPATFAPLAGDELIVIVDLADERRAEQVASAAADALQRSAVLVLGRERGKHHPSWREGITWIDEDELLADAIDVVLRRAAARKRVQGLRAALGDARHCAFLVQHDPDPDAIASALALRKALGLRAEHSPIVTCGAITRPENRALITELGITVKRVTTRQLERLRPLVLVDVQPPYFGEDLPDVAAVIDHHPPSGGFRARYRDIRTSYGASATMAAEYLLAEGDAALTRPLATALLYGIITDTKSLSRSASDDDLEMFAYLFSRADHAALRRIQHPSYAPVALKRFGRAIQRVRVRRGLAYVHLGRLPAEQEHIVAQLAEFCLGIRGAEISAVSGVFGSKLVMSTRALRPEARLGERLRTLFSEYGSAGGHPVMAKAVINLAPWRKAHPDTGLEDGIRKELGKLVTVNARARRGGSVKGEG